MPDYADKDWQMPAKYSEKMGRLVSQGTFPAVKVIKPRIPVSMTSHRRGFTCMTLDRILLAGYI